MVTSLVDASRLMSAVPLNDTPPIFLAFCSAVAVAELPVQLPDEPVMLPVTLPLNAPLNDVADTEAAYTVPDK